MYATDRRYVVTDDDEYLVDVFSLKGFTAIAQNISTSKFGKGQHETSEGRAINTAIENIK